MEMAPRPRPFVCQNTKVWETSEGPADDVHAASLVAQQSLMRLRHFIVLLGAIELLHWGGSVLGRRQTRERELAPGLPEQSTQLF